MFKILQEDRETILEFTKIKDCIDDLIDTSDLICTTNCKSVIEDNNIIYSIRLYLDNSSIVFNGTMKEISQPISMFTKIYRTKFYDLRSSLLNDDEQRYLNNLLYPYSEKDIKIFKRTIKGSNKEFLTILIENHALLLPSFEKDKYYKGLINDISYTPDELGLLLK